MRNVLNRVRPSVLAICLMLMTVAIVSVAYGGELSHPVAGAAVGGLIALGRDIVDRS